MYASRTIMLPPTGRLDTIKGSYKNGVVELKIAKNVRSASLSDCMLCQPFWLW